MLDNFFDFIKSLLSKVIDILPDSPFNSFWSMVEKNDFLNTMLGYLNYFIPVSLILQCLTAWLACILLYYIITPILHWSKAVKS